jgi:hypothetical protein
MKWFKLFTLVAVAAFCLTVAVPQSQARVGVVIGVAPACPYGYYPYAPYECAPYGYYGPEWFADGVFIGAGPWYHGHRHFYGHVDRDFDSRYGYRGPRPERGERADWDRHHFEDFHGREMRDEHGRAVHGHEHER